MKNQGRRKWKTEDERDDQKNNLELFLHPLTHHAHFVFHDVINVIPYLSFAVVSVLSFHPKVRSGMLRPPLALCLSLSAWNVLRLYPNTSPFSPVPTRPCNYTTLTLFSVFWGQYVNWVLCGWYRRTENYQNEEQQNFRFEILKRQAVD
jgi:hypothetical protein